MQGKRSLDACRRHLLRVDVAKAAADAHARGLLTSQLRGASAWGSAAGCWASKEVASPSPRPLGWRNGKLPMVIQPSAVFDDADVPKSMGVP
jgi:hypothetical protein